MSPRVFTEEQKKCRIEYGRAWRRANADKIKERRQARLAVDPDRDAKRARTRALNKAWKAANRDRINAKNRDFFSKNKEIRSSYWKKWRLRNEEDALRSSRRRDALKNGYAPPDPSGPTDSEILKIQNGKCAICGFLLPASYRGRNLDHCHSTGRIRGILCPQCNMAIGLVEDNPEILEAAAAYLRSSALTVDPKELARRHRPESKVEPQTQKEERMIWDVLQGQQIQGEIQDQIRQRSK